MATLGNSLAHSLGNRLGFSLNGANSGVTGALDGLATTPNALYCFGAKLRTSYSGALFRVRRASDNAELDIGFDAETLLADTAALTAHCAGTNGFVVSIYDQSGNARTLTQATAALQYKIYDSATGPVLLNGNLCGLGSASALFASRADNCGIAGTGGKSFAWCGKPNAVAVQIATDLGATGAGQGWQTVPGSASTTLILGIMTANRSFTASNYTASTQRLVGRLQASGTAGQLRLRQNGVELSELSSVNPSTASNTAGSVTRLGSTSLSVNGSVCAHAIWGADISDADADLWNTAMQTLYG